MVRGQQRDSHVGDRNRLIAVVGHHKKNRQQSGPGEVGGKNLGLLGIVIRICRDGHLLIAMEVVRRIVDRALRRGLDEVLPSRERSRYKSGNAQPERDPALAQTQ